MSTPDQVETPERVTIELDLAGIGSRALAQLVDLFLLGSVWVVLSIPLFALGDQLGTWSLVLWFALTFALYWFYHAAFEALWLGQTPGKRLLDLRVQKLGGYPIGWPEALLRNLIRPVDSLLFYGVGVVSMLVTARHQRIGDLVAGTLVVREGEAAHGELERLGYGARPSERMAASSELSTREFELLHEYFARRLELDPASATRIQASLARRLRLDLARRGQLKPAWVALPDEAFLLHLHASSRGIPLTGEPADRG